MRLIGTTRSRTTALVAAVACAGVVVAVPTAATGRPTAVSGRSLPPITRPDSPASRR